MTANLEQVLPTQEGELSHLAFPFLLNAVANVALVVWDVLLTFEEEIFFLSTTHTSFVKILYIVVRYLALILQCGSIFFLFGSHHLEANICPAFIWYITINGMTVIACSNLLFIHRVFAFYERKRTMLWFLSVTFAVTELCVVVLIALTVPKFHVIKNTLPSSFPMVVGDCVSGPYPSTIAYLWFSELVFQSIAFACVAARFAFSQIEASKDGVPASQLYTLFIRDGIWMYFLLFLTYLLNVVYTVRHPTYSGLIPGLWSFTVTSISCSRTILNINSSVFLKNRRLSFDLEELLRQ